MSALVRVAAAADVPVGRGRVYTVAGRAVAVFNVDGAFHAVENTCPHAGGPLGEGDLRGAVVSCPWHQWPFDVTTGCLQRPPALRLARFAVEVQGADLLVGTQPLAD
ncbi:MAG: Rieske (2Fe-2S) protein [Planctomycetota bacterium]